MFDIKKIRENPEDFDKSLSKRDHDPISKDILDIDKKNRDLIADLQSIQEERNLKSNELNPVKKNK